ncbi:hypothetical protein WME99_20945 [Sorangium sp. So ce136]|uniref:hypothetical protein n=1 Tax=Sorangium sp. So ce136 TaxID=3133284 RepID=UPI003F0955F9
MRSHSLFALVGLIGALVHPSRPAVNADAARAHEDARGHGSCKDTTPAGYDGFLVFMANGSIPLSDGFFLDGAIFQEEVMGRTPAEIEQNRADALAYFESRFGIADADARTDVSFFGFYADPRINYRAYVISGERVPPEGYEVHDGGWIALVTDPGGLTLGGELAGVHVPAGTFFSFGDYSIEVTRPGRGRDPEPIVIHYQCNDPLIPLSNGGEVFTCDLLSDEFGAGRAQGMTSPIIEDGELRPNGRTVLTFSDEGGL